MEEVENVNLNKKAVPITFGSCISISLDNNPNLYLSSEGFVNSRLYVEKYDQTVSSQNFSTSVFKILPFSSTASFKSQNQLHTLLQDFNQEYAHFLQESLSERKNFIQDLKTNLDAEIHTNIALYEKLKGTYLLFGASAFQLVHLSTMKYLSLNDHNKDDLYFELVDYPNENSFFKFLPCSKLQRQRNNFVYNQDLVTITSTKVILNRNPYIYTNCGFAVDNERELVGLGGKHDDGKVVANIEEYRKWRIHLYQTHYEEDQENSSLRIGEVIWLKLSELNRYLTVTLMVDPFESQRQAVDALIKKNTLGGKVGSFKAINDKKITEVREVSEEDDDVLRDPSEQNQTSVLTPFEDDFVKAPNAFFEEQIVANYALEFKEIETDKGAATIDVEEMTTYGLWRLEPQNIFKGGQVAWDQPYRLKNLASGRYLKVSKKAANKYVVELSSEIDDDLLFYLMPIENLLHDEQSKKFIAKDAYFRMQHVNTKQWISFREEELGNRDKEGHKFQSPVLCSTAREIDTFRVVKANFEETWEISFLLSAFPIFLELRDYLTPLTPKPHKKDDIEWFHEEINRLKNFDGVIERALNSLQSLQDFAYNRLLSNLAINQEFSHISPLRQKVLREQHILGLLCWILTEGFVSRSEFQGIDRKALKEAAEKHVGKELPAASNAGVFTTSNLKSIDGKKRTEKLRMDYLRKKYKVCYRIYDMVRTMCIQNPQNQKYFFKFMNMLMDHLGYGSFVSECFIEAIRDNEKILYSLHKVQIMERPYGSNEIMQASRKEPGNFLTEVVQRMKERELEKFEREELLQLLKATCVYQDQAIYINQDKVFKLIYEDTSFKRDHLIQFANEGEELYLEFGNGNDNYTFEKFFKSKLYRDDSKELQFLKSQLDLYAALCLNRNYICTKAFAKTFRITTLINYLKSEIVPEDIKAIIVKLIATIHIDKEPMTVQEKPNLVKIADVNLEEVESGAKRAWLEALSTKERVKVEKEEETPTPMKGKNISDRMLTSPKQPLLNMTGFSTRSLSDEKDDDLEINLLEDQMTPELLEKLKDFVFEHLREKSMIIHDKEHNSAKLYTRLTYEVIKLTTLMLKFGMFKTKVAKRELKSPLLAPLTFNLVNSQKSTNQTFKNLASKKVFSEVEELIKYLTPLLEFDQAYFESMETLKVKRKCFEPEDADKKEFSNRFFNGMSDLTKGFQDIFNQELNPKTKKTKRGTTSEESEAEIIKNYIFKKPEALKKVLNKYSNKTYTIKKEESADEHEVGIKIGICEVFDYIFDMREDFVIDNIICYFKETYLVKLFAFKHAGFDRLDSAEEQIKKELVTLLPEPYAKAGENFKKNNNRLKNYTMYEEIRSFDDVLERPFMESLLMGFFFTNSSLLQNSFIKLIQRCCTQKKKLQESIYNLELLFSNEDTQLHAKIRGKLIKLKNLTSNAQMWLQIPDRGFDQLENLKKIKKCEKTLQKVEAILMNDNKDKSALEKKQKMFRYVGGHKIIFDLLQKGFFIFESYIEAFIEADTEKLKGKYKAEITDRIINIFRLCHSLLGLFCHSNPKEQALLFSNFNLLTLVTNLDIGQLKLLNEIVKGNLEIARNMTEKKLKVFCDFIVQHGKKEIFLDIFENLLDHPVEEISGLKKKMLYVLLSEEYSDAINPFVKTDVPIEQQMQRNSFEGGKDPFVYTSKLLEILAKCMRGKVGVTLISKAFKMIKIKDLVNLLHKQTEREHMLIHLEEDLSDENAQIIKHIQNAKSAAIDIMLTFFANSAHSLDELPDCSKVLFEYVQLETVRIKTLKEVDDPYVYFVLEKLVPLITIYAENYLKESGIINFDFGGDGTQNENFKRRCAQKFAKQVLGNLYDFDSRIKLTEIHTKGLMRFARDLKMQIPDALTEIHKGIEAAAAANLAQDEIDAKNKVATKKSVASKRTGGIFKGLKEKWKSHSSKTELGGGTTVNSLVSGVSTKKGFSFLKKKQNPASNLEELMAALNIPDSALQLTDLWRLLKKRLHENETFKAEIKSDVNILSNSIINFSSIFVAPSEKNAKDFFITPDDILQKLFSYLQFWIQKKASKKSIIFLIKSLGYFIKSSGDEEEMLERQNMLDRLNATRICIILICNERNDDKEYLYALFNFLIRILFGGNTVVQRTVYDFFMTSTDSEKFFRKINHILEQEVENLDHYSKPDASKEHSQLGMKLLRLLQLFCEGHNLDLQNYLRQQINSKTNYDLVSLTTKLLSSYRVNKRNFESVMQCFDTLTELIQGPCKANQAAIVNSKFLEFSVALLSESDKVIEYISHSRYTESRSLLDSGHESRTMIRSITMRSFRSRSHTVNPNSSNNLSSGYSRREMNLLAHQLAKVKYKCLITLISLLECNDPALGLSQRIIRAIPISVLTLNLAQVYHKYKKLYKQDEYTNDLFGHQEEDYEGPTKEHKEFILENGFNTYTLINLFLDNGTRENQEEEELRDLINKETEDQFAVLLKISLLGEFMKFFKSLFTGLYLLYTMIKEKLEPKEVVELEPQEHEVKTAKARGDRKQLVKQAVLFFKDKMAHIEVLRDNKIEKIYFPLLPCCKHLAKDVRTEFHETVNRSSTKRKIADLMKASDKLIQSMQHEEHLSLMFNKYKIIGLLGNHIRLWEHGVFIVAIMLNVVILASYSDKFGDRLETPHLFNSPGSTQTKYGITVLGILNLIFAGLVVTHFYMKKAPILLKDVWSGFFSTPISHKTPLVFLIKLSISIGRGMRDIDILYNTAVIVFAFLGLFVHPFFFFFMLADFLRISLLKNVVKAVWDPRVPLMLTFLVFILVQYFFAIVGYTYFHQDYNGGGTCDSLFVCFLTTWDQTFKQTGGVGAYLLDPDLVIGQDADDNNIIKRGLYLWPRFFFDDLAKIIPVIIIINMVAGIIIDKFGALKDILQFKTEDMTQYCYICGIDKEKLDKSSHNKQYYNTHIKRDHYMWDYVFYKAYLESKESTEYNGNESYIWSKIQTSDLGWFPINRAAAVKDEQTEENERLELVDRISKNMAELKTLVSGNVLKMTKYVQSTESRD